MTWRMIPCCRTGFAAAETDDDKYLDAVLKESMRLHPVFYAVWRVVTQDVELAGCRIPSAHRFPGITRYTAIPVSTPIPKSSGLNGFSTVSPRRRTGCHLAPVSAAVSEPASR